MTEKFDVILLAAGRGSRLRPITDHLPKCLVPICGVPLLKIWLDKLSIMPNVSNIHVNTSYMADKVEEFISNYNSKKVKTHYEEKLLGTAGTINLLMGRIETKSLMIAHADNLSIFDIKQFEHVYQTRDKNQIGTMMTFNTDSPGSCGIVKLDNFNRIEEYVEKPASSDSRLANAAVYFLNRKEYLPSIKTKDFDFSKDYVSREFKKFNIFFNDQLHMDIGSIKSYLQSQIEYRALIDNRMVSL